METHLLSRINARTVELFKAVCIKQSIMSSTVSLSLPPAGAPSSSTKVVVIIGAGFCGLAVLKALEKQRSAFRIVVIDKKDYFEYTPLLIDRLGTTFLQ